MEPRELFNRASTALTLATAGASHARTAANALERITREVLEIYHGARHDIEENREMREQQALIERVLAEYQGAIDKGWEYHRQLVAANQVARALCERVPGLAHRLRDPFINWAESGPAALYHHQANVKKLRALLPEESAA